MNPELSAVVITYNEAINIQACIDALKKVTDDVVVVDSESTDQTVVIAEKAGARCFVRPFDSYGGAKNFGAEQCKNDWIVSVDADEYLSEELQSSLEKLKPDKKKVYSMNILPNYCGKWIYHGAWHPDWNIRLYHRRESQWNEVKVHEKLLGTQSKTVEKLDGYLHHYSYRSHEEHLQRIERYAKLSAESHIQSDKPIPFLKMYLGPLSRFVKSFILKRGFLDGKAGWTIAVMEYLMAKKRNISYRKMKNQQTH